jgi:glycosyltransferase involved in cell wall biosynthesis
MILIEAARITDGGGYGLLKLLLYNLLNDKIEFKVILSPDTKIDRLPEENVYRHTINLLNRGRVFSTCVEKSQPASILCFGNFPPPKRYTGIPAYTYFHRVGLIEQFSYGWSTLLRKAKYGALSFYLKRLLMNTDFVFCQSSIVKNSFSRHFDFSLENVKLYPFFDADLIRKVEEEEGFVKEKGRFIFVSNGAPHKNHQRLFVAWELLSKEELFPELWLTLPEDSALAEQIENLKKKGCKIKNIGVLPYRKVLQKMRECEFAIYPSLQESLGLGLIEAEMLGYYTEFNFRPIEG